MNTSQEVRSKLRQRVWSGSITLEIQLATQDSRTFKGCEPYLIQFPRLSYLGLAIKKLHAYFLPHVIYPDVPPEDLWLSHEDVPLKWHYPLGLLYDCYSGVEPVDPADPRGEGKEESEEEELRWKLTTHFSDYPVQHLVKLDGEGKVLHDLFINSVKEADYLRNGSGKTIMSLNQKDSQQLWESVLTHDFTLFNPINQKLLNPQGVNLRHIPTKLYLPKGDTNTEENHENAVPGSLRVLQMPVKASVSSRETQTVGTMLNKIIPSLFPSERRALLANPVLHGAILPMKTDVEELMRCTSYLDGYLHIAVVMMG